MSNKTQQAQKQRTNRSQPPKPQENTPINRPFVTICQRQYKLRRVNTQPPHNITISAAKMFSITLRSDQIRHPSSMTRQCYSQIWI